MKPGDRVEKTKGYRWPGVVVASFSTIKGDHRVVVECRAPEVAGALHIYSPDQLRVVDRRTIVACNTKNGFTAITHLLRDDEVRNFIQAVTMRGYRVLYVVRCYPRKVSSP